MTVGSTKPAIGTTERTKMCSGTASRLESSQELAWDPRKDSEE